MHGGKHFVRGSEVGLDNIPEALMVFRKRTIRAGENDSLEYIQRGVVGVCIRVHTLDGSAAVVTGVGAGHGGASTKCSTGVVFVSFVRKLSFAHPDRVEVCHIAVAVTNVTTALKINAFASGDTHYRGATGAQLNGGVALNNGVVRVFPAVHGSNSGSIAQSGNNGRDDEFGFIIC